MQHLVLSGGLENGLVESGVLSALESNGVFSVGELESIYATSVGVTVAAFICIGMPPEKNFSKTEFFASNFWDSLSKENDPLCTT